MTSMPAAVEAEQQHHEVLVDHELLLTSVSRLLRDKGIPAARARTASEALCYGDLVGFPSHGLTNLSRLYLPLLESGRCDPCAEPRTVTDLGACAVVDHRRALGLWSAAEAMDDAVTRASQYGVGVVAVRGGTHFGCAGFHAARAAEAQMVGVVASNCGSQRIARPPLGTLPMLGTNPLSVAAPALEGRPFVLDMSTTVVPTGKIRLAARRGEPIPPGWLEDAEHAPVTDPGSFDRGEASLRWLGGDLDNGAHKGFGLGLAVELLSAALSGSAFGPSPEALEGDGRPHGHDDGVGFFFLAIAPQLLRSPQDFQSTVRSLFGTVVACPPRPGAEAVRYPGWHEAERAATRRREGVPLAGHLHCELVELGVLPQDGGGER